MSKKIHWVLFGSISAIFISVALFCLLAVIFGQMDSLPKAMLPMITTIVGCCSVFLGGFIGSAIRKEKGVLNGAMISLIYIGIQMAISLVWYQAVFGVAMLTKIVAFLLSGILGGIVGVNRKSKVKF